MTDHARVTADVRFAVVPEWVLYANISAPAVRLYGVLARHADKDEHLSIVGRGKLAEQMRCATDTVDRAMGELVAIGAVTIEHRTDPNNPNHRLMNRYQLAVAQPKRAGRSSRNRAATPRVTGTASNKPAGRGSRTGAPSRTDAGSRTGAPSRTDAEEDLERVSGVLGLGVGLPSSHPHEATATRPRRRDPIFETLCDIQGHGWDDLNSAERGKLNRAVRLAHESNATPDAIRTAAERWPDVMGDATLTAIGVMSNLHRLLTGPGRAIRGRPEPVRPLTVAEEIAKAGGGDYGGPPIS